MVNLVEDDDDGSVSDPTAKSGREPQDVWLLLREGGSDDTGHRSHVAGVFSSPALAKLAAARWYAAAADADAAAPCTKRPRYAPAHGEVEGVFVERHVVEEAE